MKRFIVAIAFVLFAASAISQVTKKYERWSYWMTDQETGKKFYVTNVEDPFTVTLDKELRTLSFGFIGESYSDEITDITAISNSIQFLGKSYLYGISLDRKFDVLVMDVRNENVPFFLIREIPANQKEDDALFWEIKEFFNSMMMISED